MVKNNKKNKYNNILLIIILILSLINIFLLFNNEINVYSNGLVGFLMARKYHIIINLVIPIFCIINLLFYKNIKLRRVFNVILAISLFIQVFRNIISIISGCIQYGYIELLESRYDIAIAILNILLIIILLINRNKVLNKLVPILSIVLLIYCMCYDLSVFIYTINLNALINEKIIMTVNYLFNSIVPLAEYIILIYYVYNNANNKINI